MNAILNTTAIATQIEGLMADRTEHLTAVAKIDAKVMELQLQLLIPTQILPVTNDKVEKSTQKSFNFHYPDFSAADLSARMEQLYSDFKRLHSDWKEVKNSVWSRDRIKVILDNYDLKSHEASIKKITELLAKAKGKKQRPITLEAVQSRISTLMLHAEINTTWTKEQINAIEALATANHDEASMPKLFGKLMTTLAENGSPVDSIFCYIRGATNRKAVEDDKRSLKKVQKQFSKQNLQLEG